MNFKDWQGWDESETQQLKKKEISKNSQYKEKNWQTVSKKDRSCEKQKAKKKESERPTEDR